MGDGKEVEDAVRDAHGCRHFKRDAVISLLSNVWWPGNTKEAVNKVLSQCPACPLCDPAMTKIIPPMAHVA